MHSKGTACVRGAVLLLAVVCVASIANAAPTIVRCQNGETIGSALSRLNKQATNILKVSGNCQENVVIEGFDSLRIVGNAGTTLTPVPPTTANAIEVTASRAVSIEGLTIRITDGRTAILMAACDNCLLKNVTLDGGTGLNAWWGSHVSLSRVTLTGTGGWTSIGAWDAVSLDIQDSVFEGPYGAWKCGLCVGFNTTGVVLRSTFRGFGQAIGVNEGAQIRIQDGSTLEDNWCGGADVSTGGLLNFDSSFVRDNGGGCGTGGISVDNATLSIANTQVTGNAGGGIRLNHHAIAQVGVTTLVSANIGPGLEVRNGSMAIAAQDQQQPEKKAEISGNQGADLRCDSISHINNRALITPTASAQCTNLWDGDGPP
jgi:hypothetical protein